MEISTIINFSQFVAPLYYENFDLQNIYTPVNPKILNEELKDVEFNADERRFLVNGFKTGFDLGYRSDKPVQLRSKNLKLTVGSQTELWNKVMKEVKEKRFAGPYKQIPFKEDFIQSPIGLVPKDHGLKTRLIFHLSYPRGTDKSVNANTPSELCTVTYQDIDAAIRLCLKEGINCKLGKSDLTAAFRQLPIKKKFWRYLIMKARSPFDNQYYYFIDKCLPFGSSISCALFQRFSDALSFIVTKKSGKENVNYLDDFLFIQLMKSLCDHQINIFLDLCKRINLPVSAEKTEWSSNMIVFLGLLIDAKRQLLCIPFEKLEKARNMILYVLSKKKSKITLLQLQQLCGTLNFLCKAIVPGRAFTRRLYLRGSHLTKKHHHLPVNHEMKEDLRTWLSFLNDNQSVARPFFHFNEENSEELFFYTDASRNSSLGCGGICDSAWFIAEWRESDEGPDLIEKYNLSIAYLELYALTVGALSWLHKFKNRKVTVFCDNQSVVHMVNNTSSSCGQCMILIRLLVIECLRQNTKLKVKYVTSKNNKFADLLSRLKYAEFRRQAKLDGVILDSKPTPIPQILSPLSEILSEKFIKANK